MIYKVSNPFSRKGRVKYLLKKSVALSRLSEPEIISKIDNGIRNGGITLVYPEITHYDFEIGLEIFCAILEKRQATKERSLF